MQRRRRLQSLLSVLCESGSKLPEWSFKNVMFYSMILLRDSLKQPEDCANVLLSAVAAVICDVCVCIWLAAFPGWNLPLLWGGRWKTPARSRVQEEQSGKMVGCWLFSWQDFVFTMCRRLLLTSEIQTVHAWLKSKQCVHPPEELPSSTVRQHKHLHTRKKKRKQNKHCVFVCALWDTKAWAALCSRTQQYCGKTHTSCETSVTCCVSTTVFWKGTRGISDILKMYSCELQVFSFEQCEAYKL